LALVAGLIAFALLEPPLGGIVLGVAAVVEVGEAIFWTRYLKRFRVKTGVEALAGEKAQVITECRPLGKVRVRGELWAAECALGAGEGDTVRITAVRGLTLEVEPSAGSVEPGGA
jgi:membrane-bound serine protease (ClpP class)